MTTAYLAPTTGFSTLQLPAHVLADLTQLGYTQMTPVQAAARPVALLGKDLIAQAKTGSGKTAAFGIALLVNLNARGFNACCADHTPNKSTQIQPFLNLFIF